MSRAANIELDQDIVEATAQRAAQEGMSVSAYISLILRRSFERAAKEESVLVYDRVAQDGDFLIEREAEESDQEHEQRSALYRGVFGRN